ncbi:hypothetical protein PSENEW3n2_00003719 [Picochlorum sp. SENEW3]|nr:hypothetical protein PSENEW3n2_00003719 [Picochlorum sp. SENEW3]WPT18419.1 hypothetical protein PSENEW3_00003719 [Picochlorum sp. SENEW3]
MQGDRGLQCDSDKAYKCRHVARVREALQLDVEPEEEESDPCSSSSDDEVDVLPTNAWISDTAKSFKIEYKETSGLVKTFRSNTSPAAGVPPVWKMTPHLGVLDFA